MILNHKGKPEEKPEERNVNHQINRVSFDTNQVLQEHLIRAELMQRRKEKERLNPSGTIQWPHGTESKQLKKELHPKLPLRS